MGDTQQIIDNINAEQFSNLLIDLLIFFAIIVSAFYLYINLFSQKSERQSGEQKGKLAQDGEKERSAKNSHP